ncbi:TIGR02679 family protein [Thiocystis violacea]|uniref:TIGR02679 family protein n=1 Tax=Thiocystis violacea TaxID=13725 RepID=UPI0019044371|nr:TIGR02679 family protein [Thiocystis violacea]MBK1724256.1 TIGR02679 family protein [Thiocystis violacea]
MTRSNPCSDPLRVDLPRLKSLLDRPELARILQAVRVGLERGGAERVSIADPTAQERRALDELLGRRPSSGKRLGLPLRQLEDTLRRAGLAQDLRAAMEGLGGPLRDLSEERADRQQAWRQVFDSQSVEARRLGAAAWLLALEAEGVLKRLADQDPARAETLLRQALSVLHCLPEQGKTLSTLAAGCLGDAHGLDAGQPVATLVRRALAADDQTRSTDELWAAAGVLVGGGISSTVLALNLPAAGDGATAAIIRTAAGSGEPLYLTLRQLLRAPPVWTPGANPISICENPAVVAEAANALGLNCAPLICTRGQPSAAVTTLLNQLAGAGARLRYHGDFDWPGIRIANGIINRHGAVPWRMSAADYREAADSGKPLIDDLVAAAWDPELSRAMQARGQVIEEERVIQALLTDLDSRANGDSPHDRKASCR